MNGAKSNTTCTNALKGYCFHRIHLRTGIAMQFCNPSIQEVKGSLDYTVKLREREREVG